MGKDDFQKRSAKKKRPKRKSHIKKELSAKKEFSGFPNAEKFLSAAAGFGKKYGVFLLALILLATLFIRYALPVRDGDLFWQMEYGKYLLENRTLVPDHTIYSRTPTDDGVIYCAWIGEIALYLMHKIGGLPLLFAFRYFCILFVLWAVWFYGWRMGRRKDLFTYLVLMIVLCISGSAMYLKPEIMSMVFMAIAALLYFFVKSSLFGKRSAVFFLI